MAALQFDYADVIYNKERAPKIVKTVINRNEYFRVLTENGRFKPWKSGKSFIIPFDRYDSTNDNVQTFTGWDLIDSTPQPDVDGLTYNLKNYVSSFSISYTDELHNHESTDKLFDLHSERAAQAHDRLENKIAIDMMNGGASGKGVIGLATFISTSPTSGTNGGVARTEAFNQNKAKKSSSDFSGAATKDTIINHINKTMVDVLNRDSNFMFVAGGNAYTLLHSAIEPRAMMTSASEGFVGFKGFDYAFGAVNARVVFAGGVGGVIDADSIYMINPKSVHARYHPKSNFTRHTPVNYQNQMGTTSRLTWSASIGMILKDQAILEVD